jgi:hypothetical protein
MRTTICPPREDRRRAEQKASRRFGAGVRLAALVPGYDPQSRGGAGILASLEAHASVDPARSPLRSASSPGPARARRPDLSVGLSEMLSDNRVKEADSLSKLRLNITMSLDGFVAGSCSSTSRPACSTRC